MNHQPPLILLVYANDRVDPAGHLRDLVAEIHQIQSALEPIDGKWCQVVTLDHATTVDLLDALQLADYRDRIAILHFSGHADEDLLQLEGPAGTPAIAHAAGLAEVLAVRSREGSPMPLVFLNGCATAAQAERLLEAGCPAVIATAGPIDDRVASEFATRFYRLLAAGESLGVAFAGAAAAIRIDRGEDLRALYWGNQSPAPPGPPWRLYASATASAWTLPETAGDLLFGLPPLPQIDLPPCPFRHLDWFDRPHAPVFFGRERVLRTLFAWLNLSQANPILLFFGQSGVGKSSVLAAGLLPRLEATHCVRYLRRDARIGLAATLRQALAPEAEATAAAWHRRETAEGRPLLIVLDQVEEVFNWSKADPPAELVALLDDLAAVFGEPAARPRGRLILSFRKECLAELDARLKERPLPFASVFLEPLDRRGIIAAIRGPTLDERLRAAYGIDIEDGLPEEIADDLRADSASPVAPTLQILLTKLWTEARGETRADRPCFTRELYLSRKRDGILLGDFLDQQLRAIRQWRSPLVDSGLALDLLAFHTTDLGTATAHTEATVLETYSHLGAGLRALIQREKDSYLLTDIPTTGIDSDKGSRLTHDTLAPLVRARFEQSDRPGQRARRILEGRAVDWRGTARGAVLDGADLKAVEAGAGGMRVWNADEDRLVSASRRARWWRHLGVFAVALTLMLAGALVAHQWRETLRQQDIVMVQSLIAAGKAEHDTHPITGLLLSITALRRSLEITRYEDRAAEAALREVLKSVGGVPLNGGLAVAVSPDGACLATIDRAGIVRLYRPDRVLATGSAQASQLPPRPLRDTRFGYSAYLGFGTNRQLVAADRFGGIEVWTLKDCDAMGAESRTLGVTDYVDGEGGGYGDIALDPRGNWLAAVATDPPQAYVWNLREPRWGQVREFGVVTAIAFDPTGKWLAMGVGVGSNDVRITLRDLDNFDAKPRSIFGFGPNVGRIAFDASGNFLATTNAYGEVIVLDLSQPENRPWRILSSDVVDSKGILVFGPGGRLAVAFRESLWLFSKIVPKQSPKVQPRQLGLGAGENFSTIEFDPSGLWMVTSAGASGIVFSPMTYRTNRAESGPVSIVLKGHDVTVSKIVFDPQGRWFATAAQGDDSARLWSIASLVPAGAKSQAAGEGSATSAAEARATAATGAAPAAGTPTEIGALIERACAIAGRNLTLEQWQRAVGKETLAYEAACPQFPSGTALKAETPVAVE